MLAGVGSGMFLAGLDHTIVSVTLPTMVGDLGGINQLPWVVSIYILAQTATVPLWGKLGDLYGRRRLFRTAIALFVAASGAIGLSQNMGQLILARGVQGIGAGGIVALAFAILGDIMSPRQRGQYQAYLMGLMMLAHVAGPLIGGFLVDGPGWPWAFYLNVPVGLVALAITQRVLPGKRPEQRSSVTLDYLGAGLLVTAVSCLILVTVWGGDRYDWGSPTIVFLAVTGTVLLTGFVMQERRAPEPVLPPRMFRDPVFTVTIAFVFVMGLIMFPAVLFTPLFLQVVRNASATTSGTMMLPLMAGFTFASALSGRVISRTGRYRMLPIVGTVVTTAGYLALTTLDAESSTGYVLLLMPLAGLGLGLVMPTLTIAIQNAVAHRDLGAATSALQFFRFFGASFGTAVYGTIFTTTLASRLGDIGPSLGSLDARKLTGSPSVIRSLPPEVRHRVVEAFSDSVHRVFIYSVPVAIVAVVMSLVVRERPLRDHREHAEELADLGMS